LFKHPLIHTEGPRQLTYAFVRPILYCTVAELHQMMSAVWLPSAEQTARQLVVGPKLSSSQCAVTSTYEQLLDAVSISIVMAVGGVLSLTEVLSGLLIDMFKRHRRHANEGDGLKKYSIVRYQYSVADGVNRPLLTASVRMLAVMRVISTSNVSIDFERCHQ